MRLTTDLSIVGRAVQSRRSFDPGTLFRGGHTGAWLRPIPGQTLFQDIAGTIPATQPGQSVARMLDLSGSGRHATQATVAARPVLARHPAAGTRNRANGAANFGTLGFWNVPAVANGITVTKTASDATGVEYRVHGTATGLYFQLLWQSFNSRFPAVQGNHRVSSLRARLVAGTYPTSQSGLRLDTNELNVANSILQQSSQLVALTGTMTRYSQARTLTEATATQAEMRVAIRVEDGATVDFTVRIEDPQFEVGLAPTAYQTNLSAFDITEGGQRDLWYLSLDGIDDFMGLASAFTPAGAWTLAAACDWQTGFPASMVLGAVGGGSFVNLANGLVLRSAGVDNGLTFPSTTGWPTLAAGQNRVDMIRVQDGATAQAWRNATPYPGSPVITGLATPVAGFDTLGRSQSSYGRGRLYDLLAIDRDLDVSEIVRVRRHFAHTAGVMLT